jgi:hypothetical protein
MPFKRGQVVLVFFPDSNLRTAKRRPALIIQADNLNTWTPPSHHRHDYEQHVTCWAPKSGNALTLVKNRQAGRRSYGLSCNDR